MLGTRIVACTVAERGVTRPAASQGFGPIDFTRLLDAFALARDSGGQRRCKENLDTGDAKRLQRLEDQGVQFRPESNFAAVGLYLMSASATRKPVRS
jgi:hypothetical protein